MKISSKKEKSPVVLSDEEMAALDEGILLAESGQSFSWEEVKEIARSRRKEWKNLPNELSA